MEKFGESFDTLALAATVKSDTINALAESISDLTKANISLTKTNVNLAATNKKLNTQIKSTKGRCNQLNNQPSNNTKTTENNEEWPPWCDTYAYCFTCGYKLRKGHDSSNFPKAKNIPTTRRGQPATTPWVVAGLPWDLETHPTENYGANHQGKKYIKNIVNICQTTNICRDEEPSGSTNPPNVNKNTAFLDTESYLSLMGRKEACKRATIQ